eukprot:TRINITY_DN24367_c0_g1_i1.p1 TRINITY_DN24367_c0_g1~~TRINITY_DN24367_c0_g1_i1.p1  ORF type:complete len:102 (+),score=38.18 TRINITY_DN24367_c0_g1_i1:104-409(+)
MLSLLLFVCLFFFLMIRRPPRSTQSRSSAASDVYKRQHDSKHAATGDLLHCQGEYLYLLCSSELVPFLQGLLDALKHIGRQCIQSLVQSRVHSLTQLRLGG